LLISAEKKNPLNLPKEKREKGGGETLLSNMCCMGLPLSAGGGLSFFPVVRKRRKEGGGNTAPRPQSRKTIETCVILSAVSTKRPVAGLSRKGRKRKKKADAYFFRSGKGEKKKGFVVVPGKEELPRC